MTANLVVKKDREFSLLQGHPWVYREAVKAVPTGLKTGDEVRVFTHKERFIGIGLVDLDSPIFVRLIEGAPSESLQERITHRITSACHKRKVVFEESRTNAYRLVNGEGDGLGGLILDKYSDAISLQTYSLAWEKFIPQIVELILKAFPDTKWIWKRNQVRNACTTDGLLYGRNFSGTVDFLENGLKFRVNLISGQKTGFFLDQRENRNLVKSISKGKKVANICGYTGAFTVYALAGGARETITVDSAAPALEEAETHLKLNGFNLRGNSFLKADMYEFLSSAKRNDFDLLILDPPSMAKSKKDLPRAVKAYQKLNSLAIAAVCPGGKIFSASCSTHMGRDQFLDVVLKASLHAGKKLRLLAETHHPIDHPILLGHPEGRYLHGLLLEIN